MHFVLPVCVAFTTYVTCAIVVAVFHIICGAAKCYVPLSSQCPVADSNALTFHIIDPLLSYAQVIPWESHIIFVSSVVLVGNLHVTCFLVIRKGVNHDGEHMTSTTPHDVTVKACSLS